MTGFKQGELILSSTPYAYILRDQFRGKLCDYCFKAKSDLKRCSQCAYLYFCDKNCQMGAWKMHKNDCKLLKRACSSKPDELTRLFALILFKLKKHGLQEPYEIVGDRKVSLESLNPHIEELKEDVENTQNMLACRSILSGYIGLRNLPPPLDFAKIYGKVCTSVFNITNEMIPVGCGLYLGATAFQHSCTPEAAVVYDGTTLNIRMRKSVSHRDLDKIHVSLLGDILLREERQKYLWENKYFRCECAVCSSTETENLMTKLVDDAPETKIKAVKCQKDFDDLLLMRRWMDVQAIYYASMNLLKTQSEVFANTNIYKVKTLRIALDACSKLEQWDDARILASALEKPLKLYFGDNHPDMAYFLFSFGKIFHYLERQKEAVTKLTEASSIFEVTHGKQHPMLDEVDGFLQRVLCKMYGTQNVITRRQVFQQSENVAN